MTKHEPLKTDTYEPGTEVTVQSTTIPENFTEGIVGEDGIVRNTFNGAVFVKDNYEVVGKE
jgi:hypothetical protein